MAIGSAFPEVLAAARAGGGWAWERLYRDLSPVVLGFLRARGAPEPEDALGETFLQVVRDLPSFEGDERAFRAWVLTIAHRRLLDDVRRRSRRPVHPAPDEVLHARGGHGDVHDDALRRLDEHTVRAVMAELSPDQATVLTLRILGDLTIEEIAEIMNKRPGAVKALQRRGLDAVRRRLGL